MTNRERLFRELDALPREDWFDWPCRRERLLEGLT